MDQPVKYKQLPPKGQRHTRNADLPIFCDFFQSPFTSDSVWCDANPNLRSWQTCLFPPLDYVSQSSGEYWVRYFSYNKLNLRLARGERGSPRTRFDAEATKSQDNTLPDVKERIRALRVRNPRCVEVSSNKIAGTKIWSDLVYVSRYHRAQLGHLEITNNHFHSDARTFQ